MPKRTATFLLAAAGWLAWLGGVPPLAAAEGKAVLVVSSYLPELFGVCDTLAVMCRGKLTAARPVAEWTPEQVIAAATGDS